MKTVILSTSIPVGIDKVWFIGMIVYEDQLHVSMISTYQRLSVLVAVYTE